MRRDCFRAWALLGFAFLAGPQFLTPALAAPATQMFWTDQLSGRILRANLDGTNVQTIYQAPVVLEPSPVGVNRLAIDEAQGMVYWSDNAQGTIQRMSLVGGTPETVASSMGFPRDLEIDTFAGKLYWSAGTQVNAGGIFRANLDGSQVELLVPVLSPGIALDLQAGHLYYAQFGLGDSPNTIHRANLDGSSPQLLIPSIKDPDDVDLDLVAGKMYYVNEDDAFFYRANLDGSSAELIINDMSFESGGHGLAISHSDGKLYWTSRSWGIIPGMPGIIDRGSVRRSNLDGTNVEILISGGLNQGIVIATPVPEPASIMLAAIGAVVLALAAVRKRMRAA